MDEKLRYPIGKFIKPENFTTSLLTNYIRVIAEFPLKIAKETSLLTEDKLDTPYRPNGWTIRQVVNHCADSHMHALTRFKFALTEERPVIKPYLEAFWAELPDSLQIPVHPALSIIKGVHERWVVLMNGFTEKDWEKGFVHPEKNREIKLNESAGSYAWHCEHHLAHITTLKTKMGWE